MSRFGCIKTGCDVVFANHPNCVYRADAFYYQGKVLFRVRPSTFVYDANPDFIIFDGPVLEAPDTILVSVEHVSINSKAVFDVVNKHYPDVALKLGPQFFTLLKDQKC